MAFTSMINIDSKRIKLYFLLLTLLLINLNNGFAQNITLSDKTTISVVTCDAGTQLHSLFGHTALRINDPINNFDAVYNFGYFDFNTPNFYLKFIKGDMQYFAAVDSFEDFLLQYIYEQRGVYEQVLNIPAIQKQRIFDDLNRILQSEERFYTYKFIDRNCTTMIVDLLNRNMDVKIPNQIASKSETYRKILYGYVANHFYENLGISIIFGAKTDTKFSEIFLPLQLLEGLELLKNQNPQLVSNTKTLYKQSVAEEFSVWNNVYTLLLFLIVIIVFNKKWLTFSYFILIGIVGVLLIFVSFYSLHAEVRNNYNVLLFNPLYLVLVIASIQNIKKYVLILSYVIGVLLIGYTIFIANKAFFLMFLPLIICNGFLIYRNLKTSE